MDASRTLQAVPPDAARVLSDFVGFPSSLMPRPAGLRLLLGPAVLPAWTLASLCPLLAGENRVAWVEGRNGFDAQALGKRARALGMDPRDVLSRVHLARPFSAFQMETIVSVKLPALLPARPVLIADPLAPFDDEDLPEKDADRTFVAFLEGLRKLSCPLLGLVVERERPRRRFFDALLKAARATARLVDEGLAPRLDVRRDPGA